MEQSKTKKRGTFAAKIIVMVILAVIVSNVICMVFILESSKKQITDSTKHTMERVAENRYLVDEPAIDRYLALLPTFQLPASSLPESAYETLLFRLLRGEMEEAEFCQEMDRIQRAWLMENQIAFGE